MLMKSQGILQPARGALLLGLLSVSAAHAQPEVLTTAQWREDLEFLVRTIEEVHPNPYFRRSADSFRADVDRLKQDMPGLSPDEIIIRMMQLVASLQDGHTNLEPTGRYSFDSWFPVRFYEFTDGLHITAIGREYAELVGAEVVSIGAQDPKEARKLAASLQGTDNEFGRSEEIFFLSSPRALKALGVIASDGALPLRVRTRDGEERAVEIRKVDAPYDLDWRFQGEMFGPAPHRIPYVTAFDNRGPGDYRKHDPALPLHLRFRRPYSFEYLPDRKTIYMQFNFVQDMRDESFADFNERLWTFVEQNDVDRFVLDLRYNGGGNGEILQPLIHGFIRHDTINRPGYLFTLVGRKTFSAGVMALRDIDVHTKSLFIGEPAASAYNLYGDPTTGLKLPHSGLSLGVSTLYWQLSRSDDHRQLVPVDIPARFSSSEYFAGRDPALEAALQDPPLRGIVDILADGGGSTARSAYDERQQRFGKVSWWLPFNEREMNSLGYELLADGRPDDALVAFELNTLQYPRSWNVWDSFGEANLRAGDKEKAYVAYKRAVEIEPQNSNCRSQRRIINQLERAGVQLDQ
jgi:tetratricopeptide (TPR) repeat protein